MALALYVIWAMTWLVWVLLALAPPPENVPEWLLVTREVCFGSLPDRLPQAHGWISLAAPIPMLIVLIALCRDELLAQFRQMRGWVAAVLLVLPFLTVGYMGFRVWQDSGRPAVPAELPLSEDYPTVLLPAPEFRLQDQQGRPFTRESLLGGPTVLTFAYAHCQTVCPGLLASVRDLSGVRRVVVTIDPWRDTCGSMKGLARLWGLDDAFLLTGSPAQVEKLTKAFEVPTERDEKTGEITHPALVFVLDSKGRAVYRFTNPSQSWLAEALRRVGSDAP